MPYPKPGPDAPNVADGRPRRRRLRPARLLRLGDRDAEHRPAGGRGPALQPLPRHLGLLGDPGRAAHRAQPPRGRDGRHPGGGARVPRLHRADPEVGGQPGAGAARQRLQHAGGRQVAPGAEERVLRRRPVRPLAARPGLRALLRLPRRRDQPVGARAGPRQHPHRPAVHPGGGLPPHRGPGRPGDPDDPGPAAGRVPQAVLPLLRARRRARPAPGDRGVGDAVRRPVRRRLGGVAAARLRPPGRRGDHPGRHGAARAAAVDPRLGDAAGRPAAALRPLHGGLRRASSPTPTTTSAGSSPTSRSAASPRTPS